jgi:hypothetical protein
MIRAIQLRHPSHEVRAVLHIPNPSESGCADRGTLKSTVCCAQEHRLLCSRTPLAAYRSTTVCGIRSGMRGVSRHSLRPPMGPACQPACQRRRAARPPGRGRRLRARDEGAWAGSTPSTGDITKSPSGAYAAAVSNRTSCRSQAGQRTGGAGARPANTCLIYIYIYIYI